MISWQRGDYRSSGKALFLDRDGVINRKIDDGYVLHRDDFVVLEGFVEAVQPFVREGIPIIIISNQSCVGRGLLERSALIALMGWAIKRLEDLGIPISGYVVCPHEPQSGCACRKPEPGMLLAAGELFSVDVTQCAFIGDSDTDIKAGEAAGCPAFLAGPFDSDSYLDAFGAAFDLLGDEKCLISR